MQNFTSIIALIEDLINDHDCIIIPNFGGFVVNVEDFIVQENPLVIYPRKKWIAFNERLKSDDGILSTQWATKNNLTNKEAFQEINQFGKYIKTELSKNQKITFGKIGEFKLNPESNIEFLPNKEKNYDLTMFGLNAVTISSIPNKPKPNLIEPVFHQNIQKEISQEDILMEYEHKKQILPKHYVYTLIAFIFTALSAFYLTEPKVNSNYVNSSFSPFSFNIKKEVKRNENLKEESIIKTKIKDLKITDSKPKIDSSKVNPNNQSLQEDNIHLIAASFLTLKKAEEALIEFKNKGFKESTILAKKENETFYRVSIGVEATYELGYVTASRLKKENKIDIWVYKPSSL